MKVRREVCEKSSLRRIDRDKDEEIGEVTLLGYIEGESGLLIFFCLRTNVKPFRSGYVCNDETQKWCTSTGSPPRPLISGTGISDSG